MKHELEFDEKIYEESDTPVGTVVGQGYVSRD